MKVEVFIEGSMSTTKQPMTKQLALFIDTITNRKIDSTLPLTLKSNEKGGQLLDLILVP